MHEIRIKLIGVGSSGWRAVESMAYDSLASGDGAHPERIYVNTDAGAAEAASQEVRASILEAHMAFFPVVLCGSAAPTEVPVLARLARELGTLTVVGVVTPPTGSDGLSGISGLGAYLAELCADADAVIVLRCAKFGETPGGDALSEQGLTRAYSVLGDFVHDLANAVNVPGYVGVDFEDVASVLAQSGRLAMGAGAALGADRARIAAEQALANCRVDTFSIGGTERALVLIAASRAGFALSDAKAAMDVVRNGLGSDAHIVYGTTFDDKLGDLIRVTVVSTSQPAPTS